MQILLPYLANSLRSISGFLQFLHSPIRPQPLKVPRKLQWHHRNNLPRPRSGGPLESIEMMFHSKKYAVLKKHLYKLNITKLQYFISTALGHVTWCHSILQFTQRQNCKKKNIHVLDVAFEQKNMKHVEPSNMTIWSIMGHLLPIFSICFILSYISTLHNDKFFRIFGLNPSALWSPCEVLME